MNVTYFSYVGDICLNLEKIYHIILDTIMIVEGSSPNREAFVI